MLNKPIFDLKEQDFQELINKRISESLQLEYKETIDISTKGAKKELCKDVSAMANAFGGKIIYGIKESKQPNAGSIPIALTPIKDHNLKESMQQVITDGILPRMDFQIHSFESITNPGNEYVVIDIPQTIRGSHFVCLGGENRFYKRRDFESKKMDQREIEDAYRNFFFQEMKMHNLYDQIKKENPNRSLSLPQSAYCSFYFIPQYPIDGLFYTKFDHSSITDKAVNVYKEYLTAYNDVFYNSYDGFTNVRKEGSFVNRIDTYFRNGCVCYSFSLYTKRSPISGNSLISFDMLGYSIVKIANFVSEIYNECGYIGNIKLILETVCIDNFQLYSSQYFSSHSSINKGLFNSSILTDINKLTPDARKELKPLFTHFIQSFGIEDDSMNKFFDKVYFKPAFIK